MLGDLILMAFGSLGIFTLVISFRLIVFQE